MELPLVSTPLPAASLAIKSPADVASEEEGDARSLSLSPATTTAATMAATPLIPPEPEPESKTTAAAPAIYCLCRRPDDGSVMVECEGCADWYHVACVGLPLHPPAAAAAEAEATAAEAEPTTEAAAVPTPAPAFTIPDDWRCPRCTGGTGVARRGGRGGGRKRERRRGGSEEEEDSEAEAEAVEEEVEALLQEQGVQGGVEEDEELAACLRREVERRRALARRLSPLEVLPDALLQHITGLLPVLPDLLSLAEAAPGVSVARGGFWRGLARTYGLAADICAPRTGGPQLQAQQQQPRRRTRRVARSLRTCARRAFFRAFSTQAVKERVLCDDGLSRAYALFCKPEGDSVAGVKRILAQMEASVSLYQPPGGSLVEHKHTLLEGNTLLNLAARCGCLKVIKYLVQHRRANMLTEDVGGFTCLLNAIWRDDPAVVRFFLGRPECTLAHLLHKGTSRRQGPYDAEKWAEVRGHMELAALLRRRVAQLQEQEQQRQAQLAEEAVIVREEEEQEGGVASAAHHDEQEQDKWVAVAPAATDESAAVEKGEEKEGTVGLGSVSMESPPRAPAPMPYHDYGDMSMTPGWMNAPQTNNAAVAVTAAAAYSTSQVPWRAKNGGNDYGGGSGCWPPRW